LPKPVHLALTLPGEASLGAFEAGAVSALVAGVQEINTIDSRAVCVDAITGASSGALTGVLAAKALLSGQDPIAPLHRAWVDEPTIEALMAREQRAPLTLRRARQVADELLAAPATDPRRAQDAVTLEFALTSLRGFTYDIRRPGPADPTKATSYLDWARHELTTATAAGAWRSVVDSAIASASHPAAFAPSVLDREAHYPEYQANGVLNLPDDPELWYSDGGLLDREPLGRCLRIVRDSDRQGDVSRHILVIRPEDGHAPPAEDGAWTDADDPPAWKTTLARALRIMVTHSLYEDLRRVEKTNTRIAWSDDLADLLTSLLEGLAPNSKAQREVEAQLDAFLVAVAAQKATLRSPGAWRPARPGPPANLRERIQRALAAASGLEDKNRVTVEVVSPGRGELAGGSLLQSGGFFAERLRANDFLVGYRTMLAAMEDGRALPITEQLTAELRDAACGAARRRSAAIPGWTGGVAARGRPPLRTQARVARIALRATRLGLRAGGRR
jgi:predicted acylesterase/phospholipase RssA